MSNRPSQYWERWNPIVSVQPQFIFNTLGLLHISLWAVISFPYDPSDTSLSCIVNEFLIFNRLTVQKVVLCKHVWFSFQAMRMNFTCRQKENGNVNEKEVPGIASNKALISLMDGVDEGRANCNCMNKVECT